jgi:hypothetical protein
VVGIGYFPWQRWQLIHGLELRPDGRFRFRTVLVLVARQNGKTTLVEIKNLWKMYVLRVPLVIGTAQNLDISEESWDKAVDIVLSVPELAAEKAHIDRTNGKKALRLTNGSRWKIAAASHKGGRGLAGDDVNLDELREHRTWDSWGAVTKTTMARRNAQIWAYSNAGDDSSIVLNNLQSKGRLTVEDPERDPSLGLFEWSAPDDCPIDDPVFWGMSNPSLGYDGGVGLDALRSAAGTDPEGVFRTECLCQRVSVLDPPVIPARAWAARGGAVGPPDSPVVFGLSAAWPDAEMGCIAVAGRKNGETFVQLVTAPDGSADYRDGTSWMPARVKELQDKWQPAAIMLDDKDPAAREKAALEAAGVNLTPITMTQAGQAYGMLISAVMGDKPYLRHYNQPELNTALAVAGKRPVGDAHVWARKGPTDISPIVAVTHALYGLATRTALTPFVLLG